MKKIITWLTIFALLAFTTQWLVVRDLPDLVFKIAIQRTGNKLNTWINAGPTNANMRRVVMPNPDFVYSALFYDISNQPVTVTGILPDSTYASISFYDDRCQPYSVYNNLDSTRHGKFEFTLVPTPVNREHQIMAKTAMGVIICRFLKSSDSSYQQLVGYQKTLTCITH